MSVKSSRWETVTAVPSMPSYLTGVTNLQGTVITLVDLRGSLGLPSAQTALSIAVVVRHGAKQIGVLVDHVPEIHTVAREQFLPAITAGRACRCASLCLGGTSCGSASQGESWRFRKVFARKWMEAVRHCRESKRRNHTGFDRRAVGAHQPAANRWNSSNKEERTHDR